MDTKRTIRKILFVTMWMVIGSGMLVLLIAAMDRQKKELCKGYEIKIKSIRSSDYFLDNDGIAKVLRKASNGELKGKSKASFNLLKMEEMLEKNVWVKDAQLYFDNHAVLHVSVEEREPIARIFTAGGKSFYMDADNHFMPLNDKTITRVPVFTGFPDKKNLQGPDSVLLNDMNKTASYISGHPFWNSQVAQIDIVADCGPGCWEFEMIPLVGRHVVKLGDGEMIDKKFEHLFSFYQQVLTRAGIDHYKTIDVRYAGQVIGGKSENPKVDSVKLAKSVNQMLKEANEIMKDTIAAAPLPNDVTAISTPINNPKPNDKSSGPVNSREPKAVMPKQHSNN